jgi:hypothetical protein
MRDKALQRSAGPPHTTRQKAALVRYRRPGKSGNNTTHPCGGKRNSDDNTGDTTMVIDYPPDLLARVECPCFQPGHVV